MAVDDIQHVFIVGSKGIPGSYGGYETFVDKLTEYHRNEPRLKYHVACKSDEDGEFEYHNARCFKVKVPDIGPAQAIYYDVAALNRTSVSRRSTPRPTPVGSASCAACERGLSGVRLVVGDAHAGLARAVSECLPAAGWQRGVVHLERDVCSLLPSKRHSAMAAGAM